METQNSFIKSVEIFLGRYGMAETTFGREATGSPRFVQRLREGVSPTLRTVAKVKQFMGDYARENKKG